MMPSKMTQPPDTFSPPVRFERLARALSRWLLVLLALVASFGGMMISARADTSVVLVEAEQFADLGGWVVDQQFMDQMGSPYLLAHGLGVPVRDATTTVKLAGPQAYRVWVRTRDWVAPWRAPGAPGKFQLLLNGQPLPTTFGIEGADWQWQDGGIQRGVHLPRHGRKRIQL